MVSYTEAPNFSIWCQWCLGHMNHADLVDFLRRARAALREDDEDRQSYIFVKENCCDDGPGGIPQEFMDEEDSSLTRYVHLSSGYGMLGLRHFGALFVLLSFLSVCSLRYFAAGCSSGSAIWVSLPFLQLPYFPSSIFLTILRQMTLKHTSKIQVEKTQADHSLFCSNRSSAKWLQVFADAGLKVVKEVMQEGMPEELFVVKA